MRSGFADEVSLILVTNRDFSILMIRIYPYMLHTNGDLSALHNIIITLMIEILWRLFCTLTGRDSIRSGNYLLCNLIGNLAHSNYESDLVAGR